MARAQGIWDLRVASEILGASEALHCHADAIGILDFEPLVACNISLWQMQKKNGL
jgi:hypothetical protein